MPVSVFVFLLPVFALFDAVAVHGGLHALLRRLEVVHELLQGVVLGRVCCEVLCEKVGWVVRKGAGRKK